MKTKKIARPKDISAEIEPEYIDLYLSIVAEVSDASGMTPGDHELILRYVAAISSASRWRQMEKIQQRIFSGLANATDDDLAKSRDQAFVRAAGAASQAQKAMASAATLSKILKLGPVFRNAKVAKEFAAQNAASGTSLADDLA